MYDTIVIGAGFAGLSAAKSLCAKGHDNILVLEAADRVGGRTKLGTVAGMDIDLGGMWLGPSQLRLKALAEEFQVQTYKTHISGNGIFRVQGRTREIEGDAFEKTYSILEKLDFANAARKLSKLEAELDCNAPWKHPCAKKLDGSTVEQWAQENVRSASIRQTFRLICLSLFCAEASQVSMLFFVHYVKSGEGLDVLLSQSEGGAQNILFRGGVHQIARKIAEELGDILRLSEPVSRVDWSNHEVVVQTKGGEYRAKSLILAVPGPLLPKIDFDPPLPMNKQILHQRSHMGSVIKYWIGYERPFWRESGFNGLIMVDDHPCSPCMDATPPDNQNGVLAGFFDANHALDFSDVSPEGRRQAVIEMLVEHYGSDARNPLAYTDNDWTTEQWSGGCFGAYMPPGIFAKFGPALRNPVGPLHWAGTETSPEWTGYIEGAIRSGERAAQEVLEADQRVAPANV